MALLFFKKTKDSVNCYKLKYNISFIGSVRLDRFVLSQFYPLIAYIHSFVHFQVKVRVLGTVKV